MKVIKLFLISAGLVAGLGVLYTFADWLGDLWAGM